MDIDYALSFDFLDLDGKPYQMRFRHDTEFSDTGQLIGVIVKDRPDNGHILALSRPGVHFRDVADALAGWRSWAQLSDRTIDLSAIRQRIVNAGLGHLATRYSTAQP
jgi:hypothetical protein